MPWMNLRFKVIAYFLVFIILQEHCLADIHTATSATIPSGVQGAVDVSDPPSDGSAEYSPLDQDGAKIQVLKRSRTLKQRVDGQQNDDEFDCGLSSSELQRYLDDSSRQWFVTDQVLRELDDDIQAIVNCTSENDVIVFQSARVLRPATTITLPWTLTVRSDSNVTFTCPHRGPLLVVRTPSITLENLVITSCNSTSSVVVLSRRCSGRRRQGVTQLNRVTFQDNEVSGQGHIFEANGQCSELRITGLVFLRNRCIGTHCVVLGFRNTLTDIYLANNQGSNETSLDSSIFFSSTGSECNTRDVTSMNNTMRSFYISNSTMSMIDSRFDGNRRNQSSGTRETSVGGGILFSDRSSISISNSTFDRNYAFSGGALFARSSNITLSDCIFRENDAAEGNGGALCGTFDSSFDISSSVFSKNHGYLGAGMYFNQTRRVGMVNVSFGENNCSLSCAVQIVNGNMSIESSEFLRNNASRAGAALCISKSNLSLKNLTFIGNSARFGGACVFERNSIINASSILFENNTARGTNGGAIYFSFGGRMILEDSLFANNYGQDFGGAIYSVGEGETVAKRVAFLNNTSGDMGGAVYISSGNLNGSDLTFLRNRATNSGGAIGLYQANNVSVSKSHFDGNRAASAGAIVFASTASGFVDQCTFVRNEARARFGGAILYMISNVNVSSSLFRANTAYVGGSLVFLERCHSTIWNSTFENNIADINGVSISMRSSCSLVLSNSSFSGNRGRGFGVLALSEYSNASLSRVQFVGNYPNSGGCLHLYDFVRVSVSDSLFLNNASESNSGAIVLHHNSNLTMSKSTLVGNNGGFIGGGVEVSNNSSIDLTGVSFEKNEARRGGAIRLYESSTATISNCSFTNNTASNSGGAIFLNNNCSLFLNNSTLSGNRARYGGGLDMWSNSTAILLFCRFARNNASISGGAIYLQASSVSLSFSQWDLNRARYGGSLYSFNASMEVINSSIHRSHAQRRGGAIYIRATNATLETILLESNEAMENGGGIALLNASSLLCYSCLILHNRAFSGAGMYVYSNNSLRIVAQLQNSRFENNTAESFGGGIEFAAPQTRSINCSSPSVTCGHIVLLNTSFVANYANHSGAIVLTTDPNRVLVNCAYGRELRRNQDFLNWTEMNSLEVLDPKRLCTSWKKNRVSSNAYGDVIGTYGQAIALTIDPEDEVRLVGSMASGYVLENVLSGRQLPTINVTILDGYGLGPAPTVPLTFEARLSSSDGFLRGLYATDISVGSGRFVEVVGFARPGNYTLMFMLDNPALEAFNVTAIVRECQIGEEPTRDRLGCQECDSANYNFNPQIPSGCKQCPETGNCTGRYIVPKKGHWHKSPCHDTVQSCLVEEACSYKNRHETLANFTQDSIDCKTNETTINSYNDALCNEGYKGPLCGSCKKSYGLSFRFQCFGCPRRFASLLTILGLTLYLVASTAITIKGTLPSPSTKPKNSSTRQSNNGPGTSSHHGEVRVEIEEDLPQNSSIDEENGAKSKSIVIRTPSSTPMDGYDLLRWKTTEILKILINFLQTTAVAATVNVEWTDEVLELFETSEYIGVLTTAASSGPIDCLISSNSSKTRSISTMLLTLLVPGIVISIFLTFWSCVTYKRRQNMMYFCKRSFLSIIAVTYISYLGLTQLAVRVFYCVDVYDSVDPFIKAKSKYWAVDTAVTCYGKAHTGLIITAVIVLLFVSVGFPLVSAFLLIHTKAYDQQSKSWQLETMGFLYRAFKENFVYWESVVMLRKAFLSVIVVFSYPLGGQIQGLLAALVMVFGLYFHQVCAPFRQEFSTLNRYESISLLVSCVTFILGQFFNAEKSSNTTRNLIAVAIIVANTSFFAFLAFVLVINVIEQLREFLQNANVTVSQDAPWWKVIKVYVTFRLSALCSSKN